MLVCLLWYCQFMGLPVYSQRIIFVLFCLVYAFIFELFGSYQQQRTTQNESLANLLQFVADVAGREGSFDVKIAYKESPDYHERKFLNGRNAEKQK